MAVWIGVNGKGEGGLWVEEDPDTELPKKEHRVVQYIN
jgi:hypothetical protein